MMHDESYESFSSWYRQSYSRVPSKQNAIDKELYLAWLAGERHGLTEAIEIVRDEI